MPCRTFAIEDTRGIVCSQDRPRRCRVCGQQATVLCDHPNPQHRTGTCDRPLCGRCAVTVGPDRHHCPDHPTGDETLVNAHQSLPEGHTTPEAQEAHRIACLIRWIIDHNEGDPHRIGAWFDQVERQRKPVATIPGLRDRVRAEYRRRRDQLAPSAPARTAASQGESRSVTTGTTEGHP